MKYLYAIVIFLIPIYFISLFSSDDLIVDTQQNSLKTEQIKKVNLLANNEIKTIELEEYIIGVVACEMPASFELEALKAQAVASRTYVLERMQYNKEYDIKDSISNQCYHDKEKLKEKWKNNYEKYYLKIKQAVFQTKSEYLTYEDKIIKTFFFSTSNGKTENVEDVFSQKLEYLRSVESPWDKKVKPYEKSVEMTKKEFLTKLNIKGQTLESIKIMSKTDSGRIKYIKINNTTIKGTKFRTLLGIRSTDASIEINEDSVLIITRGYGHGVGMSQYGANEMAKQNKSYKEILFHYYTGVELKKI